MKSSVHQKQPADPTKLVWLIIIIGCCAGFIMTSIVWWLSVDLRHKRERLNRLTDKLITADYSMKQEANLIMGQYARLFNLEEVDAAGNDPGGKTLSALAESYENEAYFLTDSSHFHELRAAIQTLQQLKKKCRWWAERQIRNKKSRLLLDKTVDQATSSLNEALHEIYGRRRLNLVLRYKKAIADSSGRSPETIHKILKESISDSGLAGLKSELADLTLLVEQLRSETRIDHLIDLKDNRLLTTLLRLRRVLSLLPPRPDSFKETFQSLLTSFETTLLGTGYAIQKNHQTIKTGRDGFYTLVKENLQLEAERKLHRQAVFAAFNKIHEQLRKTNDEVKNSIQIMADKRENSLQHAWQIMLLVSLVMAGVFLAISSRILSAIRGQVQKIQDTNKVLSAQTLELTKNEIILTGKQVQMEYLSRSLLTAQEDERKRIAYELHDELGQSLTALNLQVRSLTRSMGKNPASILKEKCDRLSQSIKDIIQSVRQLSQDLSPAILDDLGIEAALANLLTTFEELHDLVIVKNISQVQLITDLNTQRNLYRIIQELLTNISKHANCTIINIDIQKTGDELLIRVADNGRGFTPANTGQQNKHRKGMGLSTIAERIRIMRGTLDIDSEPDGGVKVTFTIPLF